MAGLIKASKGAIRPCGRIVQKVENGRFYTIESNSGDECRQNCSPVGYYEIYGHGVPAY
ncbi:hypothetical protein CE91St55_66980 [Hungatella hathewayi]|uniref:Uncharacterized protein n=1 Tax=Hungatella hathewayi TaxID=154046 RepID=A0AA37NNU7_9FIRM|nr:hypothetical protein CE91St55_66980 [Hungatella hathewayi]